MGELTVGLRELRQRASELVRRAEEGEEVTVTVAGRRSVRLVAVGRDTWRRWSDVADIVSGTPDPQWAADRALVDHALGSLSD
ncbi:MAG: type II toxin-antitoxin system Phd/YefM family antitoxin [Candidatus Dormibacteria bacterium]